MQPDKENFFRPRFEELCRDFRDRVDTPWDKDVPDVFEFNQNAYRHISRQVDLIYRDKSHQSRGLLILGAAGTGKTHLLMRIAQKLATDFGKDKLKSHILFVRRPNNEEAVAKHIWGEIVDSMGQSLSDRSQLDTMLSHVFSAVLIPEFERDITEGKDADQKERWKRRLEEDPYNLLTILGEGERRDRNLNFIRSRTLNHLRTYCPRADQEIAEILITYCLTSAENRKRRLMDWLRGTEIESEEARQLGIRSTWVRFDETSNDATVQQAEENFSLKAIQTIGHLSTYYRPLILAFDQLEGLRGNQSLTNSFGNAVREIVTMTPNLVILTCIFPDLWESWFSLELGDSAKQRIAQSIIALESFLPPHGRKFLETYMAPWHHQFSLPSPIFPFTGEDIEQICKEPVSPRLFLQRARDALTAWIISTHDDSSEPEPIFTKLPDRDEIDTFIGERLSDFADKERIFLQRNVPVEDDYFGRLKTVFETIIEYNNSVNLSHKAICGKKVMPKNFVLYGSPESSTLCIAILNSEGVSFSARIKNMKSVLADKDQFDKSIILRDKRCKGLGAGSLENIEQFKISGGTFYEIDYEESVFINAIYDTLIAIEESDMILHSHKVEKEEFIDYLFTRDEFFKYPVFKQIFKVLPSLDQSKMPHNDQSHFDPVEADDTPRKIIDENVDITSDDKDSQDKHNQNETHESDHRFVTDIVIGNKHLDNAQSGILGKLKPSGKRVAFSFSKPMCALIVGYMGSGKSYALGVLMENALLSIDNISWNPRPTCVIAFNYRRSPESRFEYGTFTQPNSNIQDVKRLNSDYVASPRGIDRINVLGYEPELKRRQSEYSNASLFPIKFLPQELSAEHWEILMKPPSPNAEYMHIVRKIIQNLFYANCLTFANLKRAIEDEEGLTSLQRQKLDNRLKFAETWISDHRDYKWSDVFTSGTLTVFDLRMQASSKDDALRLCLILTDIVRKTSNNVNKTIIFDEAHEYVDSKDLIDDLENAITQIRHDGLSFILASQFPERIPQTILKYLLTRMIFKITDQKSISSLRGSAPNLAGLSPIQVSNLNMETGECFLQTDDDCTDTLLKKPQLLAVRPRCSQHGGATKRS